ncbi:hypothetical protein SS1G_04333 [Sclerotinia sclerotiorum 1980 UF-70]|uniref:Xylanolytic transcriptional activator regulatory domain-containing protein n=1 Tax=Sclerotinia sclerotiorum (strain ATCC 18683 / 1980 / Ss-1) TaxID=665079 RepID=A7EG92_SCLS1|nr:hypothetical protein SS1G_04333 [Sclerotinia sclerotiorum 1980 UF-70]EDO01858.1 hypothetical protein SS1G_04333 [Sclerotinia sclerotiorum 1980 UF-70]
MTSTPYRDYLRLLAQLNFPIKNLSLPDLPIYILRFSALPLISSIFLRLFEATGLKGVNIILDNHISLLEAKLKRMEHVMTNSGLSVDASRDDRQPSEEINDQAAMLEKFSALNVSDTGAEEFWGAASGFSIFSPKGLQLISKMTGNDHFANYICATKHMRMTQYSVPASLWYAMPDDKHKPLPPREIADQILECNEAEIEQRRNVFWIAIMVERGVVIRHGRPSVIHDEDIGVDLPPDSQYPGEADGRFVTFRHNAILSLLQGRIYNRLYSAKSFTKSKTERLKIVGMLDDELQQWCETIPVEVRPGYPLKCDKNHIVTAVCMQWGYYQCVNTIHRVSLYYGPGSLDLDDKIPESDFDPDLNPRVIFIHYALAACVSLFEHILQYPLDPQAQYDIQLMNDVISFLSSFEDNGAAESHPAVPIFHEINRVAAEHVNKAQHEATQYTKRSRDSSRDVEEPYTESDESEEEDYEVEEELCSNIVAKARDPENSVSPTNSTRSQMSPIPSAQPQSDIPPEMRQFDLNPLNYKSEHIPMSMQQSYNLQPTTHDPYQTPSFYDHHTNLPDLNYQHHLDHPENDQNQPRYISQLKSEPQSYPSHPNVHTPHPATGFYFSSSEQHQQNINPNQSETYTNTLRNPNAVPQDQIGPTEERLVPQDEGWFYPMMSPWLYGEQSDSNLIVGAADENDDVAWRGEGNNGERGGLDGWRGHG